MALSINSKLVMLAGEYYIANGSTERSKINISVVTLKGRLANYFDTDIKKIIEFGSYKRDTILPRSIDPESDVDLMVVFDHASIQITPGSYRNRLLSFADFYYSRSEVYKSSPTIVLQLGHIKYDLVPAYEKKSTYSALTSVYIPEDNTSWMATDPDSFNAELTRANAQYDYQIKKIIRLLKAWNAKVGYPFKSFKLEQEIVSMAFWFCYSLEDYFFSAIKQLSPYLSGGFTPNARVTALQQNAQRVKQCLEANNMQGAINWLGHILPL